MGRLAKGTPLTAREERAIGFIRGGHTVLEAARLADCSHGTVYNAMVKTGERRHEPKLRARDERLALLEAAIAKPGSAETMDTLAFLRSVESGSVAACITSPPYNVRKAYDGDPTGDRVPDLEYLGYMCMALSQIARTLRPGGTLVLNVGATKTDAGELQPLHVLLWRYVEMAGLRFQNLCAWPTQHAAFEPKMRRKPVVEYVMIATKGAPGVFNATPIRTRQKHIGKRGYRKGSPRYGLPTCHPLGAAPTDLIATPHVRHNAAEKVDHPAMFPIAFARDQVLAYSNPGDTIMDPWVGAGATMIAAYRTGRAFCGADQGYAAIRDERMRAEIPELVSLLPGVTPEASSQWNAPVGAISLEPQLALGLKRRTA